MFEEKFQKICDQNLHQFTSSDCLQVLSLTEACKRYGVDPIDRTVFSKNWFKSFIFMTRTKPDLLNDLCLKLQEQLVPNEDQTSQDIFLLLDEVPCNSDP